MFPWQQLVEEIQPGCRQALNSARLLMSFVERSTVVNIPDVYKATQGIQSGMEQVCGYWKLRASRTRANAGEP